MKKIFILLIILSGIVSAQSSWTKYNKIEGRNTQQVKGDSSAVMVYTMNGVTESSLLVLLGYQHPSTISTGTLTTVSTEVDTTTFTSTVWQTFGAFAVDDTLEISLSGSFADSKIVYPYTAYTFEKFSPTTFSKGYIRRYGGAGTVSYIPTIKGY